VNPIRSIAGGIIATVAPYGVYRLAREHYGLQASLTNLTPKRLLVLALAFSIANPLLTNIWLVAQGDTKNVAERFFAMLVGDLGGVDPVVLGKRHPCCAAKIATTDDLIGRGLIQHHGSPFVLKFDLCNADQMNLPNI
jgi:hypothetical protein